MRIDTGSGTWLRVRTMVLNRLANWGYPVDLIRTEGLTASGYYELVLDDKGMRKIDPATNRLLVKPELWDDPTHWEWLLQNAPMEFEDGEEEL